MSVENKVPAIRFEGFSGEWASSELGKLLDITSAARVHKDEWVEDGVAFFRTSDVVSIYKGLENKKAYISFDLYKELSAKSGAVKKDDLLITGGGSIGIPYLIATNEPLYFKDADLLWLKNSTGVNGYFLFTFFSSQPFRKYISGISHIGTISHYTIEQAKSTPISVSQSEEQTKIGNYFQQLDTLIALHQKKHDKLLNLKKALLELMLPKQGATVPEIRFRGFSGEWEEKALGDNADFSKGQGYSKSDLVAAGIPIILYGRLYTQYQTVIYEVDTFAIENNKSIFSNGNEVVVPASGETAEDISRASAVLQSGVLLGGDLNIIYPSNKLDSIFLALTISNGKPQKDLSRRAQGKSVVHLRNNDLKEVDIPYPDIEEQTQIGNLFQQLDTLITQHQSQLKKLGNIKQACLEKMFV